MHTAAFWLHTLFKQLVMLTTVNFFCLLHLISDHEYRLQLLAEKGELPTRFGSATLGILLLQVFD